MTWLLSGITAFPRTRHLSRYGYVWVFSLSDLNFPTLSDCWTFPNYKYPACFRPKLICWRTRLGLGFVFEDFVSDFGVSHVFPYLQCGGPRILTSVFTFNWSSFRLCIFSGLVLHCISTKMQPAAFVSQLLNCCAFWIIWKHGFLWDAPLLKTTRWTGWARNCLVPGRDGTGRTGTGPIANFLSGSAICGLVPSKQSLTVASRRQPQTWSPQESNNCPVVEFSRFVNKNETGWNPSTLKWRANGPETKQINEF